VRSQPPSRGGEKQPQLPQYRRRRDHRHHRYRSGVELACLSTWPGEIGEEDAVVFFTLADDDLGWVRGFNRDENRLGVAVQLCTLPAGRRPCQPSLLR